MQGITMRRDTLFRIECAFVCDDSWRSMSRPRAAWRSIHRRERGRSRVLTHTENWREISPYLDTVLDLDAEARQAWLDDLATRAPAIAARVRGYLFHLDQLQTNR